MRVLLIKATVTSKYSSIVFEMVLMETSNVLKERH